MNLSRRTLTIIIISEVIIIFALLGLGLQYYFGEQEQIVAVQLPSMTKASPSVTMTPMTIIATNTVEHRTTLLRSPSPTTSPTVINVSTITSEPILTHLVRAGDTLSSIAELYDVSIEDIREVNSQIDDVDLIELGDVILIPNVSVDLIFELSETPDPDNPRPYPGISYITSNPDELLSVYPLQETALDGKLNVHYQTDSYVDRRWEQILDTLTEAYQFVEDYIGLSFNKPLDLYLASSLLRDDENLRGFTQSGLYRSFMLVDGTGSLGEQTYLFAHEFTHIFAYHQWGRFHSPMIHEGLATYLPQSFLIERTDYLPLDEICVATRETGRLEPMTALVAQKNYGPPYFQGHIRSFLYYNQSGCFVKYLIEEYGFESFGQVFASGNYLGVYGKNLTELDAAWQASLAEKSTSFNPLYFVASIDRVAKGYDDYFDRVSEGRHVNFQAYLVLDDARIAVNSGKLERANQLLDRYYNFISNQ